MFNYETHHLGIEQTLVETHQLCLTAGDNYCQEWQNSTMININFISFLIVLSPIIIMILTIKLFKKK